MMRERLPDGDWGAWKKPATPQEAPEYPDALLKAWDARRLDVRCASCGHGEAAGTWCSQCGHVHQLDEFIVHQPGVPCLGGGRGRGR